MPDIKPKDKQLAKSKKENPDKKESTTIDKNQVKDSVLSDTNFSEQERKDIIKMVSDDVQYGEKVQADYQENKVLDLKHYHGAPPSEIENLDKKGWQSDRNLGLARAIADTYQSTLTATCWTPDSINYIATRANDIDNRNNQTKFTKWGMGQREADAQPEIFDYIHNRVVLGNSCFKVYRKIIHDWVDKRIPVKNSKGNTIKYDIKTEKVDSIRCVIENIDDIDDILMPKYGKDIQDLPFFIHVLHQDGEKIVANIDSKKYIPLNEDEYKKKLYDNTFKEKKSDVGEEKLAQAGISEATIQDIDIRRTVIDLHEWYGYFTKNGRKEKYRFIVDTVRKDFLSGKPLRKINRSGKIPFVWGSLCREPGMLRGTSLMQIVAPVVNAFNNVFNQKSDFQYVTNCPIGFHNPDEGYTKQTYELEPGISYPVSGDPSKSVYFPNIQRSMAWAESDLRILFEVLERLTGAQTYFHAGQQRTKAQVMVEDKNTETRFSLWVASITHEIEEAISMWFELYQDYPPKNLAERILGEDGKQIFLNLSIDSLRGNVAAQLTPDPVAGSKAYSKQLAMWMFENSQNMVWLNPQVNPAGNWNLCADTLKEIRGLSDNEVKRYIGEAPKTKGTDTSAIDEWQRFLNGEDFYPPEGETMMALKHLEVHQMQKQEKYHDLDEEYRPNFDAHLFKTMINAMKFMKQVQQEQMANKVASHLIMSGAIQPGQAQGQPQPGQGSPQAGQPGPEAGTMPPGGVNA